MITHISKELGNIVGCHLTVASNSRQPWDKKGLRRCSQTDGGATYQPVDSLPGIQNSGPWTLASSPHERLGAASLAGDTVAISRDGGANWTTQPDVFYNVSAGFSLLSGTRDRVFWADTSGALYVAPDEVLH